MVARNKVRDIDPDGQELVAIVTDGKVRRVDPVSAISLISKGSTRASDKEIPEETSDVVVVTDSPPA